MNLPALRPPTPSLPPVGSRVSVQTECSSHGPSRRDEGTVTRHVGGWLAEVEIPGKKEPGLYAPEGMRQTK